MRLIPLLAASVAVSLTGVFPAAAQVEQCIARKISAVEDRQPISAGGRVECPAADVVGFPPRERRHNRSDNACLDAGNGRVLVTDRADAITVSNHSENGGAYGPLVLESEKRACVPISCQGAGLTEGRRWMEVRLSGQSKRAIPSEEIIEITLSCARNPNQ